MLAHYQLTCKPWSGTNTSNVYGLVIDVGKGCGWPALARLIAEAILVSNTGLEMLV